MIAKFDKINFNAVKALFFFLQELKIDVTYEKVKDLLLKHPDFPSLLSLNDVLQGWKVEGYALRLDEISKISKLPLPFIAHHGNDKGWFSVVVKLNEGRITFTDVKGEIKETDVNLFDKTWTGTVLIAKKDVDSKEHDYYTNIENEKKNKNRRYALTALVIVTLVIYTRVIHASIGTSDWLFSITKTLGLFFSLLLISEQLGIETSLSEKICSINKKNKCSDILKTKASNIFNIITWSEIGLLYFSSGLIMILFSIIFYELKDLLSWLAIISVPYVIYSIYFQGVVIKRWCVLCIAVQLILCFEFVIAIINVGLLEISWQLYLFSTLSVSIPTTVWFFQKKIMTNLIKNEYLVNELSSLKYNNEVFKSILKQQDVLPNVDSSIISIKIGNTNANNNITIISNPYCEPCSMIHKDIIEMVNINHNIRGEVIFTYDEENSLEFEIVAHIIALHEKNHLSNALENWYKQSKKDYIKWKKIFPISNITANNYEMAKKHNNWCITSKIQSTPTIYINGYKIPKCYRLIDVLWLLN